MGNCIFYYYYFFCILIFFSLLKKLSCFGDYKYPHSINLLNGNILIIHSKGIVIYDSSLTTIQNQVYNDSNLIIEEGVDNYEKKLSQIEINRFPENEGGYIIIIIYNKIYILDKEGNLKTESSYEISSIEHYYTIVPIHKIENEYIYMIGLLTNKYQVEQLKLI